MRARWLFCENMKWKLLCVVRGLRNSNAVFIRMFVICGVRDTSSCNRPLPFVGCWLTFSWKNVLQALVPYWTMPRGFDEFKNSKFKGASRNGFDCYLEAVDKINLFIALNYIFQN